MRFDPGEIAAAADIEIADGVEIGSDKVVYVSREPMTLMGTINFSGAGAATYTPRPGAALPTAGRDLHLVLPDKPGKSTAGEIAVTLDVTYADATTDTSTATFFVPSWSEDQAYEAPMFAAADFLADTGGNAGKLIKTIGGLDSVANGLAGNVMEVWSSPAAADFHLIGCCTRAVGPPPYPGSLKIPCGRQAARWTKVARSQEGDLTIEWKYRDHWRDMARYMGQKTTVMVAIEKDGLVMSSRWVYTGYVPSGGPERGDGDDETLATSEGAFERVMLFNGH